VIGLMLVAQISIVARAPDTAAACLPFELTVAARAPGAVAPHLQLLAGGPVQLLRSTVTSRVERDAMGGTATFAEGTFVVATGATGRVVLPPVTASAGGVTARAAPLTVDVRPTNGNPPLVLVRSRLDPGSDRPAESLFVGEQVDYVVEVQLNESARQRLRHNPTFFPPEMPAVLAYDLAEPSPVIRQGRHCFETLSYRRALFPLFPGAAVIPPATLTYSLPLSTSFFSREESFELRTDSARFVAVEPPAQGRPADYAGAVGAVHAAARLSTGTGRMGDPVVLTVRLDGTGNVKLWPRPVLTVDWATVALAEERVTVDTSAARVRGTKEFDWLLTPRRAGVLGVPAMRYAYFDPARGVYDVASTDSLTVDVASASLAAADTASAARPPIRRVLRPEAPPALPSHGWYWALLALAPAPAALRRLRIGRRRRASTHSAARRLRTLASARTPASPRALRRAYLDALRERVPAVGTDLPARVALTRVLRRAGVTEPTAHMAEEVLDRLDAAAFSPAGIVEPALIARASAIAAAVDAEAIRPLAPRGATLPALLLITALASNAVGMPDAVVRAFSEGVQAYDRGDLAASQRLFAHSAARAPRAVDAWANLGAAAWARGDTAHAVLGWQRALRLDPLDADARDRLSAVQPMLIGSPAYVPPLPVDVLAIAALVLWLVAWIALAFPASRRLPNLRAMAGGAIVLGIVALAGALELQDRASVRALGVLRGARDLLDAPSPGAAPAAAAVAGDVGRLGAREGAWVRITLDGARAGWLPAAAVLPLDGNGAD
jgi:tetratricopeptide (TPR) repeat protein